VNLGRRTKHFRASLGMSQQELADLLGISRPAVSQIEAGRRTVSADELVRLSEVFRVPLDVLVGLEREPEVVMEKGEEIARPRDQVRISVPQKSLRKLREVLLYILSEVGSKPNVGETVIYKLLYFIDFDHYEEYEEQLIGARYQKNRYGPTPVEFKKVVDDMIAKGEVVTLRAKYFKHDQKRYLAARRPDLTCLSAPELKTIDRVLARLSDMTAGQISEHSHNDVPWLTAEDGQIIDYEAVFYRTPVYSVRDYGGDIRED
jgi:transcriptional regulator with XRE-family HTH domain